MQRPKPEGAEGTQSPRPCASPAPSSATPGALQPLSASAPKASSGSFEIRRSPKPDLAAIPAHDLQAQALANLRLNSRNSFLVVPSRAKALCPPAPAESLRTGILLPLEPERGQQEEPSPAAFKAQREPVTPPKSSPEPLVPVTYIDDDIVEPEPGDLSSVSAAVAGTKDLLVPRDAASSIGTEMEISAVPFFRPYPASPGFAQRGGHTFTVVPKRKPPVSGLAGFTDGSRVQQNEGVEDEEEIRGRPKPCRSPDASQPGPLLKTRYPKAHEIEVIGGYLSLERSCISKKGSRRKKMKISFNEMSLQTMFEYPSESSLAEEDEEEEEEEFSSEMEDDKPSSFFIPHPNSTLHPNVPNSGLSSYTPKHSVEFGKWQEQKYEDQSDATGAIPKEVDASGNQVMLTPADRSCLSDFSSEPALYF
ncbi:PREDICTED: taperin [Gavialis gangeticus]|uniref:taperin n=1 Tax=Gavialis gangeticus TaxID=94835 RepID=UPI00092F2CAD|nr:PREDICTED: taperin [Gavialis gangeticus]